MEHTGGLLNSLYKGVTGHVALLRQYVRATAYRKMTDLLADLVRSAVIFVFTLVGLLFLSVAAAIWIGEASGSMKSGFLIIAFVWILAGVMAMIIWKKPAVRNAILARSDSPLKDYAQLVTEEKRLQASLRDSEQDLQRDFESLRAMINPGEASNADPAQKSAAEKKPLASPAIDFILRNVVLRGAGPVKRLVIPAVANMILNSRAMEGRSGLLSRILRKLV